jgi:hypothetical protein
MATVRGGKHFVPRSLLALSLSALVVLGASGCGDSDKVSGASVASTMSAPAETETTITTSRIPSGQPFRGDGDADNPSDIDGNGDVDPGRDSDNDYPTPNSYMFPDADDKATFAFGHWPSAAEARAIANVVRRYYAAGSVGDGIAACSLLSTSFVRSVPESYGQASGPPYLRGAKSCASVIEMLFGHFHEELSEAVTVVEARVDGNEAQVVLGSRKMRASHVFLMREGRSWKVQELLGQVLP